MEFFLLFFPPLGNNQIFFRLVKALYLHCWDNLHALVNSINWFLVVISVLVCSMLMTRQKHLFLFFFWIFSPDGDMNFSLMMFYWKSFFEAFLTAGLWLSSWKQMFINILLPIWICYIIITQFHIYLFYFVAKNSIKQKLL